MITEKIHENWKMCVAGTGEFLPAVVPGSVYNDLLRNGRMEDPYYRCNELKALEIMENDFEYVTFFDAEEAFFHCGEVLLHFDGIDTIADIYLNGTRLGSVKNMHRVWEFPVKKLLRRPVNELKVVLHSPTKYIREADEKERIPGSTEAMAGFPYLRKAHCMFGWDWGPRLPDAGIWRDVKLIGYEDARIDSVYITQQHGKSAVILKLDIDVERTGEEHLRRFGRDDGRLFGLSFQVEVVSPEGKRQI